MSHNPPAANEKPDYRRARLPSFKMHDESEENLEKVKQFKADNQVSDAKRNRTSSLDL